jgi:hypothetical protein
MRIRAHGGSRAVALIECLFFVVIALVIIAGVVIVVIKVKKRCDEVGKERGQLIEELRGDAEEELTNYHAVVRSMVLVATSPEPHTVALEMRGDGTNWQTVLEKAVDGTTATMAFTQRCGMFRLRMD